MKKMKQCEVCENALSLEDRYCSKCGAEQPAQLSEIEEEEIPEEVLKNCPNCNEKLGKDDVFCTKCGVKVKD